jgi:hypothetical protein
VLAKWRGRRRQGSYFIGRSVWLARS